MPASARSTRVRRNCERTEPGASAAQPGERVEVVEVVAAIETVGLLVPVADLDSQGV